MPAEIKFAHGRKLKVDESIAPETLARLAAALDGQGR
jgi:hypothetical protein